MQTPESSAAAHDETATPQGSSTSTSGSSRPSPPDDHTVQALEATQLKPKTHLKSGIVKPAKLFPGMVRYGNWCASGEPSGHLEAMGDERWKKAMDDEYAALIKNNTWHLFKAPAGKI